MIEQLFIDNPLYFCLFASLALVTLIQFVFIWGLYGSLFIRKKDVVSQSNDPVSVIICARNEKHNLKKNLPRILNQDYSEFEVIVVDDASDDESGLFLESLARQNPKLKVVYVNSSLNFFKGKKFPLSIGIRSAQYDTVLLTDADCYPSSKYWIQRMMASFTGDTKIVLGYTSVEKQKGFLNAMIRYDNLMSSMRFLSMANRHLPYTGSGRNMAYRKELFYQNKGFVDLYHITAGDDDLFINKVVNKTNTVAQTHKESHIVSSPKKTFRNWVLQKRRQKTGAHYYKFLHKWILGWQSISQFLFFLLSIVLMVDGYMLYYVLIMFALREISFLLIFKNCMNRFEERKLLLTSLIMEVLMLIINPIFLLSSRKSK